MQLDQQSTLTEAEVAALEEALDDEYKALAIYDQVVADFGEVRPFINVREAEQRHIDALHGLFSSYGIAPPESAWPGEVPRFRTIEEVCEAGVAAEIENRAMYDRLMKATQRPDILTVFSHLRAASEERHLPAFRRCVERKGGGGRGPGGGHGRGPGGGRGPGHGRGPGGGRGLGHGRGRHP